MRRKVTIPKLKKRTESDDFLSQEEVNALLMGVTGEKDEEDEPEEGVRSYDLGRQERIVRGRMPTLELMHERFARYLRVRLFKLIRRSTEISVGPIRIQKYSEFIRNLVVPTNLNLITSSTLDGVGLLVLDPNLVFLAVDNVFGGDGRFHTRVEGRDFTRTEGLVIDQLTTAILSEYAQSFSRFHDTSFKVVRREMNTQFANIATPSEVVMAVSFTIELAGNTADFHICMPYSMLEPIRDLLYSSNHTEYVSEKNPKSIGVTELQVTLRAETTLAELPLHCLKNLSVGETFMFDEVATLYNEDVPLCIGTTHPQFKVIRSA